MSNQSGGNASGIGFCGLLTILFVALKLTSVIDWAWYWVLAPTWIPVSLFLLIAGGCLVLHAATKP